MLGIVQLRLYIQHRKIDPGHEAELITEILIGRKHAEHLVFRSVKTLALDTGLDPETNRAFGPGIVRYSA